MLILRGQYWRVLVACSVGLSIALLALVWGFTWQRLASEQAIKRHSASIQQQNVCAIIAENLEQVLGRGRLMSIVAEGWFNGLESEARNQLVAMQASDRLFLHVALYDKAMQRVYSSAPFADRPSLQEAVAEVVADGRSRGIHQVRLAPRLTEAEQAWQVPLLMPVSGADGQVRGAILLVLDLGYFLQLYQHVDLGHTGALQVLRADGEVVAEARQAGLLVQDGVYRDVSSFDRTGQVQGSVNGDFMSTGRDTLSSFYHAPDAPFYVVTSRETQDILADYHATRRRFLITMTVLSAFIVLATWWVAYGIRRQGRYALALVSSNQQNQALITQLEEEKRRAFVLASHDHLTGLANRRMFNELLNTHLQQARRNRKHYALMYLDLDRFKAINDTLGHHVGDLLLQAVSQRLRAALRESDVIARLGGDEFAVLVTALDHAEDAIKVAEKLLEVLSAPYLNLDGHDLQVTPSMGVALYPRDGQDVEALCRAADLAMYQSKRAGRGRYTFFDAALTPVDTRHSSLERRLPKAIERGELVLHFQPKVRLSDFQIVGFEALVRWKHPEFGLIYPGDFIPYAERTGLIVELGDWVAEACCQQLAKWRDAGVRLVPVAFNVSAMQLHDEALAARIGQWLKAYDLPASLLQVEITETSLVESMDVASRVLNELEALGVQIALDDFGSGFSSLGYIRTLPIHCLKIDRGFINDIRNSHDDAIIVNSIITLAHNLKMKVVAEGVEMQDQLVYLKTAGCDEVQGYFFSRPVEAAAAEALLLRPSMMPS